VTSCATTWSKVGLGILCSTRSIAVFFEEPGRISVGIAEDLAADGVRGRARDAGELERFGVRHREVANGLHEHRVVRRDRVDLLSRQVSPFEQLRGRVPSTRLKPTRWVVRSST
jgi:hypothetical protein